jgi:hypothetical protein
MILRSNTTIGLTMTMMMTFSAQAHMKCCVYEQQTAGCTVFTVLQLDLQRRGGIQLFTLNRNGFLFDVMPNKKAVVTLQSVFYSKRLLIKLLLLVINSFSSWIFLSAVICTSYGGSKCFSAQTIPLVLLPFIFFPTGNWVPKT